MSKSEEIEMIKRKIAASQSNGAGYAARIDMLQKRLAEIEAN